MARTFTLTPAQRERFDQDGVLRLPGFLPAADAAAMADALWADLRRRFDIRRDDPASWTVQRPAQFQTLVRAGAFARLERLGYPELAQAFLGEGCARGSKAWALPLVTFPTGETWDVPHNTWHLDLPAAGSLDELPALRLFCLLEPVEPRAGGTPYLEASHRVVLDRARRQARAGGWRSGDMRETLKAEEPWLAALMTAGGPDRIRRFMIEGGVLGGVPVKVREMTGQAGDVIVMHPAVFHTLAPNALARPRLMLTETFYRKGTFG
ncbi:hypothetical protein ACO2Q3_06855 [Caulobacter sp. KR2-114]|uniref:hypothetical protein n=1 Tax=Caulobacter sp. KR2-114 TaxID=3400912 RepID=UPI003C01062F